MSAPSLHCASCSAAVTATQRFCPACGEIYPGRPDGARDDGPLAELLPEVVPLIREKAEYGAELEQLAAECGLRELTPVERQRWEQAYTRWRDVASEITLLVDRVHPREDVDRRAHTAPATVERRSRQDRRDPFWGRAP